MNIDELRREMIEYRQAVDDDAMAVKDSYLALERLHALSRKYDIEERPMANQILAEWVLSEDVNVRFDALALIDDFHIVTATPALHELATRLESTNTPDAPFELKTVMRIIQRLNENRKVSFNNKEWQGFVFLYLLLRLVV